MRGGEVRRREGDSSDCTAVRRAYRSARVRSLRRRVSRGLLLPNLVLGILFLFLIGALSPRDVGVSFRLDRHPPGCALFLAALRTRVKLSGMSRDADIEALGCGDGEQSMAGMQGLGCGDAYSAFFISTAELAAGEGARTDALEREVLPPREALAMWEQAVGSIEQTSEQT